ncbi:hypothetical protein MM213_00175 [Belliella sp. R4-6]|uniref:DUF937 domain-containing protein n=1 Tax=Belliella alkalica TaxID=1730871 RepID=A0ABS9V635_9BACT|nr:hypothetical protein [Belliella alkalica]MCH7411884.1 hypothetical protein [Belliella alkalica]
MIQNIIDSLSPQLLGEFKNKFGMGNEQASSTLSITKESLSGYISKEVASGNFEGLANLLNQSSAITSNPIFKSMIGKLVADYGTKLGISEEKADSIASFVLPKVISSISGSKSGDFGKSDILTMLGSSAGDALKGKASDMLKKGLGNFFS